MVGLSVVVADDDGGRVLGRHGSAARLPWLLLVISTLLKPYFSDDVKHSHTHTHTLTSTSQAQTCCGVVVGPLRKTIAVHGDED